MTNTIQFGKIDYYGKGRKVNAVDVKIELRYNANGKPVLSICGDIWNAKHTDLCNCGQNLDTIREYIHSNEFEKVYRLWKLYHLNDMHAGTPKQEKALKDAGLTRYATTYKECCDYLESIGLFDDGGIKFGYRWNYEEIPAEDLKLIEELINS